MKHPAIGPYDPVKIVVMYVGSEWRSDGKHGVVTTDQSGGGGMDARIARLEANVESIQTSVGEIKQDVREIKKDAKSDFRILFASLITAALGLGGIMAKGFGWFS